MMRHPEGRRRAGAWTALPLMILLGGVPALPRPAEAGPDAGCVRMAAVTVRPGRLEEFRAVVRENMEISVREEPGVLALHSMADPDDPHRLTFFELYRDEAAYEAHRATPHFRRYIEATRDMVADKILLRGIPFEMHDKGSAGTAAGAGGR